MATCHTATNEFLRQFYSAIYSPSVDHPMSSATPAQKAAKATKMAGYISRTPEKVASIAQTAQEHGINAAQIEMVRG
jgi:transcription initiation factor TFIIH subunit 1